MRKSFMPDDHGNDPPIGVDGPKLRDYACAKPSTTPPPRVNPDAPLTTEGEPRLYQQRADPYRKHKTGVRPGHKVAGKAPSQAALMRAVMLLIDHDIAHIKRLSYDKLSSGVASDLTKYAQTLLAMETAENKRADRQAELDRDRLSAMSNAELQALLDERKGSK